MAITSSNQLRMTPYEQAVSCPSYLSYSTNNEHPNSEHLLLKHVIASNDNKAGGINIMTVCGGADNFLSILAKTECPIASLVCVDQNSHQLALEAQDGVHIIEELTDKLSLKGAMLIRMAFGSASDLAAQVPNACKFDKVSPNDLALVDYSHFWFRNPNGFAILRRR